MADPSPTFRLNNGVEIPGLGFGTFESKEEAGLTHEAVLTALDAGYRHLDCAWYYRNEEEVGSAIQKWLSKNPTTQRKDIFVTTKVWPHLITPEGVEWSLDNSLKMLKMDYVDCYLLHWPFSCEKEDNETVKLGPDGKYVINREITSNLEPVWRAMEKLTTDGKTRTIGVSNWTIARLESMLSYAKIPPAINQVEIHPFLPNSRLIEYCLSKSILPAAYSPLGSQNPKSYSPIGAREKLMDSQELKNLATGRGATLAQLLIAWGLRRGYVVLPKSSSAERIKSNAELVELSQGDFEAVNRVAVGKHTRFVDMKDTFGYDVWADEPSD